MISGDMKKLSLSLKLSTLLGSTICLWVCFVPTQARAHVKWFAPYNVAQAPVGLTGVLNPTFIELLILTLALLWTFCTLERTAVGVTLLASVDEVFSLLRGKTDTLIRAGTGGFFVAIWAHGGIILTA